VKTSNKGVHGTVKNLAKEVNRVIEGRGLRGSETRGLVDYLTLSGLIKVERQITVDAERKFGRTKALGSTVWHGPETQ